MVRERDWQDTITQAARALGWSCYHPFDSRRSAPGFPDLCCVRPGRLVFLEVKTERGRVRPEQMAWLDLLGSVPGVVARLARPSDWDAIEALLREA